MGAPARGRLRLAATLALLLAMLAAASGPPAAAQQLRDIEITEWTVTPSPFQAGAATNTRLFMRFCDPGLEIVDATNASPIVITTGQPHGIRISPSSQALIRGVRGNTEANGLWPIDLVTENGVPSATKFALRDSTGNGPYDGGGFAQVPSSFGCNGDQANAPLRDFMMRLPPGMLGDPTSLPSCPTHLWTAASCPKESLVGHSVTRLRPAAEPEAPIMVPSPVYNVQTLGLEPARLGTRIFPSDPSGPFPIVVTMRESGDYGLNSALIDIPRNLGGVPALPIELETYLCGLAPCEPSDVFEPGTVHPLPGASKYFFRNPTSCKPAVVGLRASSWAPDPAVDEAQTSFTPTGCDAVPFTPKVTVRPSPPERGGTSEAGVPSAYDIDIAYPHYDDDPVWQSALREVDIDLPRGVTLSAGAGAQLEACSAADFGFDLATGRQDDEPTRCPANSRIGEVSSFSHVLPLPLVGDVFFGPATARGRPTPDRPWKLFMVLEGNGLRIKLAGDVTLSEDGQVKNLFVEQPELPFETLELKLNGGSRAVLANPAGCGPGTGRAVLTGWSGGVSESEPAVSPSGCSEPRPFSPVVEHAGSEPEQAGGNTTSRIVITRPDGQADIRDMRLSLPAGAVGKLSAVPQCALADAQAGRCPDSSKIGTIRNTVGGGDSQLTVQGSLYLAEPSVPGDAATIAITVPAKAGPIDLGDIVLTSRVVLRPQDTGIDVIASGIPRIFEGVPLPLRRIELIVDRENFFVNPTGCEPRPLTATFASHDGQESSSVFQVAATGCERLPFSPRVRLIAGAPGLTKGGLHPPLSAIVTQESGEASIAGANVLLPDILRPNTPFMNLPSALCNDAQLAQRACPELSLVGHVTVITPVLPFALTGPVHIVQEFGSVLPNLVALARGNGLEVLLRAKNRIVGVRTLNNFVNLPDVSQTYFRLDVEGGENGILNAWSDLCRAKATPATRLADASFTAHTGQVSTGTPVMEIAGCESVRSASITSRRVRATKSGVAKVKISCRLARTCSGRLTLETAHPVRTAAARRIVLLGRRAFSIPAGTGRTVQVRLRKVAQRALRRDKRLRTRATARIRGAPTVRSTFTLVAPRR